MELSYLMITGSLSGLISILAHSVLWSGLEWVRGSHSHAGSSAQLFGVSASEALLHMFGGLGLGVLFWLSWGLAAVVEVTWWVRGLSFASLCWLALTAPVLLDLAFARALSSASAWLSASRWATTCAIAGLTCAWSWERLF
jgi:hypothetical protein